MKLEKIISLANHKTRIPLLAMIRSLRKTGCQLPVVVIPYSNDRFDLPENCTWWVEPAFFSWLDANTTPGHARSVMRKYQCLLDHSYQFVDSDVVFLRNPEEVLKTVGGFVSSCLHWSNPEHTFTPQSLAELNARSTLWAASTFNSGQFASEHPLYSLDQLISTAGDPRYRQTILDYRHHEQPGMNLLVHLSRVPVVNLTQPPHNMESTWAGDYALWPHPAWRIAEKKPYLIHWAGAKPRGDQPIDTLFFELLTPDEAAEWNAALPPLPPTGFRAIHKRIRDAARAALRAWRAS